MKKAPLLLFGNRNASVPSLPLLRVNKLIPALLAISLLPVPFIENPVLHDSGPSWLGIDDSWAITFNYAFSKGWYFGSDIVYNYGPLSFFASRCGYGISRWVFLAFDLFVIINFFLVFRNYLNNAIDKPLAVVTLLCATLLIGVFIGVGISWILLFFIFYWGNQSYVQPRPLQILYLGFLVSLSFFIKLNTGLVGIVLYTTHLLIHLYHRHIKLKQALYLVPFPFALVGIGSVLFHVSVAGYLKGVTELIKGYNEVMYLNEPYTSARPGVYVFAELLAAGLLITLIHLIRKKQYRLLAIAGTPIVYVLLLVKQATIRCDIQHLTEFHLYSPLILFSVGVLYQSRRAKRAYQYFTLIIIGGALLLASGSIRIEHRLPDRFSTVFEYFTGFTHASEVNHLNQRNKRYIPERVLQTIKKTSVDIFPWDSEYILQNHLNYEPRPVFQSFSVYTPYLQQINKTAYEKKAPGFIIYDTDAIDDRQPFNDELYTNLFILKNYIPIDTFTSNEKLRLLLKKKDQTSPVLVKSFKQVRQSLLKPIEILPECDFIKINIRYTPKGKMTSLIYMAPPVKISCTTQNGQESVWRTSAELLKCGILTRGLVNNSSDFLNILTKSSLREISKIRVLADTTLYDHEITIEYFSTDAIGKMVESKTIDYRYFNTDTQFKLDNEMVVALWSDKANSKPVHLSKGIYAVTFICKGTPAGGVFPHVQIFMNNHLLHSFYVSPDYSAHQLTIEIDKDKDVSFLIKMDNDLSFPEKNEDRNAFFREIVFKKTGELN